MPHACRPLPGGRAETAAVRTCLRGERQAVCCRRRLLVRRPLVRRPTERGCRTWADRCPAQRRRPVRSYGRSVAITSVSAPCSRAGCARCWACRTTPSSAYRSRDSAVRTAASWTAASFACSANARISHARPQHPIVPPPKPRLAGRSSAGRGRPSDAGPFVVTSLWLLLQFSSAQWAERSFHFHKLDWLIA